MNRKNYPSGKIAGRELIFNLVTQKCEGLKFYSFQVRG